MILKALIQYRISLKERTLKKKMIFINELIESLNSREENSRFKYFLSHITEFYDKCNNAYQFYLRDFSYNKLKIELDSKALEYTQKIQSVINDSQTKLIAIPTAFVLVFAAFDFTDLLAIKNIATILSLFIFALLIQFFLNNILNFFILGVKNFGVYINIISKIILMCINLYTKISLILVI